VNNPSPWWSPDRVVGTPGGRTFEFTRINITPTILPEKIEDLRDDADDGGKYPLWLGACLEEERTG
jgi:hypothetical protein